MKFKMGEFTLLNYQKDKKLMVRFVDEMKEDILVCNLLSGSFDELLKEPRNPEKIEIGNSYIVSIDGRRPIGYLHFYELSFDHMLELRYAIHPDYRGYHYGSALLSQATDFSFFKFPMISGTRFIIHPENFKSRKCALHAFYQEEENHLNQYVKYRNKI